MRKILAISALTLAMAGGALAQTTSSTVVVVPETWNGPVADAFFVDTTAGTLRPEAEIRTNFAALTAEQQAAVRLDCEGEMELSEAAQQACNFIKN